MLLKGHHVLHLIIESEFVVDTLNDKDFNLDIFYMTVWTSESIKEFLNKEL
jgi:hypothetical protein